MEKVNRVAVILFNLGGPDSLDAVKPFLFNLFRDPAIIAVPNPIRWMLAKLISHRRAPIAREIYRELGGASPILKETESQAESLRKSLEARDPERTWAVEIAMRYWHPFAAETAARVKDFGPDGILLLPLYPQYSTTTTGSSVKDWRRAAAAAGLDAATDTICCYPDHRGFAAAQVGLIAGAIAEVRESEGGDRLIRLLMSAHGLPKRVIARGDPYQWQVEQSVAAIRRGLEARGALDSRIEPVVCYQSRVGPLEWIGPATDDEIRRAGGDGAAVIVVPVAFVSEHSETLVELDIEYAALAGECGVPRYTRVAALGCDERFIAGLADLAVETIGGGSGRTISAMADKVTCGSRFPACPLCPGNAP
ncbi:MAG: ferrochelatase [Alphaproteobacteria bacterium]|nr:ferrochelatase [Alphaproteobacteria bacterium]